MQIADKIDDEGFFRVKTKEEYSGYDFDVNMLGSIGYNALGHFTSLTNAGYMSAMKQFGYTSYWMEVGNSGGTVLTDALLSVKYTIERSKSGGEVYQGDAYGISKTQAYLPLGVISQSDIIQVWQKTAQTDKTLLPRAEFQSQLANDFFCEPNLVTVYNLEDASLQNLAVEEADGKYILTPKNSAGKITFQVLSTTAQTLYFNAFDENSNALSQSINKKFSVQWSGRSVSEYPTKKRNGALCLGEYSNAVTTVTVTVKDQVIVRDLSVFAIGKAGLAQAVENTETVGLQAVKNGYYGKYTATGGECVFLSVGYDEGMSLTINGKKAKLYEVYGGFTAFYLQAGENEIKISYTPPGFVIGLLITLSGVGLVAAAWVLWLWKKRRLELPEKTEKVAYYTVLVMGAAVVFAVYFLPLILCA